MKKLLVVAGLVLAAFSFQAGAATIDMDGGSGHFSAKVTGAFTHDYTFTVPSNIGGTAHLSNSTIKEFGKILGFSAKLDGVTSFEAEQSGAVAELHLDDFIALAAGVHHLIVSGTGITTGNGVKTASYSGNIVIAAQTPIPGAVWLFGSALMGLVGAKRRKIA